MLDDVREWISDNLIYILMGCGGLVVILIIGLIIGAVTGSHKSNKENKPETTQVEQMTEAAAVAVDPAAELVSDDTAVLTLVKQYYTAVKSSDTTTLSEIMDPWDDNVKAETLDGKVIEDYYNIHTYSKPGLTDGEYVVYTYYEAKMANIETMAPTLVVQYVKTAADGNLKLYTLNSDDTVKTYVTEASAQADVQALIKEVKTKYENALNSDAALKAYIDTLDTSGEAEQAQEVTVGSKMVSTADVMNVRSEPSTSGDVLVMIQSGTEVTVLETAEGGWVKISCNVSGMEVTGYVMAEYLAAAPGSETAA